MNTPTAPAGSNVSTQTPAFDELLNPDGLSALMRSTWTWDDRALRRDLAAVLVDLDTVRYARPDENTAHLATLQARAYSSAARFIGAVLGPKLIADTGNPLRTAVLADSIDAARFDRDATESFIGVRARAADYATTHGEEPALPSSWMAKVGEDGVRGLGVAMRAYGYTLSDSNFFANMALAWQTLRAVIGESAAADSYADRLQSGVMTATLAAAEQTGSWDPALVKTRAAAVGADWQLTGVKQFVPAADSADVFLVIARSTAGPSLFAVEKLAPGVSVAALNVIDPTRPLWQVELSDAPAELLGTEGAGGRLMITAMDLATTALAGEQVGLVEKSMGMVAELAAQPDGDLTLETRLAAVTLDHVAALALWQRALAEHAAGSADTSAAASAAHVGCSAAAMHAATTAAEVAGPSEESDAVLRRALSGSLLFGGPALSYERHLERLGV